MLRQRLCFVIRCGAGDREEGAGGLLRALRRRAAVIYGPAGAIPHQPLAPLRQETELSPVSCDEPASIPDVGVRLADHGIDWVITADIGNARRLVARHGGKLRFLPQWG